MMGKERDRAPIMPEYRIPGSRFDRMMTLIERGACEEEFKDTFGGKAEDHVYSVVKAIHEGTISEGQVGLGSFVRDARAYTAAEIIQRALIKQERLDKAFKLFDEGHTAREVEIQMGMSRGWTNYTQAKWAIARGIAKKKGA